MSNDKYIKRGYAVVGYPAAGKSTVAQQLSSRIDAELIETGDIVRDSYRRDTGSDPDDEGSKSLGDYSTMRRERDGGDYVAQDLINRIELWDDDRFPKNALVISGMRDTSVPEFFDEYFDEFIIVWVHAHFDQRLERLQQRGRQDEGSFEKGDLAERDGRESMWGTGDLTFMSDYKILNHGDESDLTKKVEMLIKSRDLY